MEVAAVRTIFLEFFNYYFQLFRIVYIIKIWPDFCVCSHCVYCLIGDGESAEGSVWEALAFSSHYKLDNLVAIFDINRLGQSEATTLKHDMDVYQRRLEAFG